MTEQRTSVVEGLYFLSKENLDECGRKSSRILFLSDCLVSHKNKWQRKIYKIDLK